MTERTIDGLLQFVQQFEKDTPLHQGVKNLVLRRLLSRLAQQTFVEAVAADDFELAEYEVIFRHEETRGDIAELDSLLSAPAPASKETMSDAIAQHLSDRIDLILTASVRRLPAELRTRSTRARVIRTQYAVPYDAWQKIREELLDSRRPLEFAVAKLARTFETGEAIDTIKKDVESTIDRVQKQAEKLQQAEDKATELTMTLQALYTETLPFLTQTQRVVSELCGLRAAFKILGWTLTPEMDTQLQTEELQLNTMLESMNSDFDELPTLQKDPVLVSALTEFETNAGRINQVLNPIRPSVFTQPLERPEEIRRMALMCMYLYTDPDNDQIHRTRQRGIGKESAAEVLMFANFIDETEIPLASDAIFQFSTSASQELVLKDKPEKSRGWWRYHIAPTGISQAQTWLKSTINLQDFVDQIETGINNRRQAKAQDRQTRKTS